LIGSRANYKNAIVDNKLGQILQDQDFYKFEVSLRDPELFNAQIAKIQSDVQSKMIPEAEGNAQIAALTKAQQIAKMMPKMSGMRYKNLEARRKVFDLLSEKFDIVEQIKTVDDAIRPSLEKQIADINSQVSSELDKMDAEVEEFGTALPAGRTGATAPVMTSEELSEISFNGMLSKIYNNPTPQQRASVRYMYEQLRGMAKVAGPGTRFVVAPTETTQLTTKGSVVFDKQGNVTGMGSAMVYIPGKNTIVVNPNAYAANVYAHEASHPFIEFLKETNTEGFNDVFGSITNVVKDDASKDLISRGLVDTNNKEELDRVNAITTYGEWAQFISEKVQGQDAQIEAIVELMSDIFQNTISANNKGFARNAMIRLFDTIGLGNVANIDTTNASNISSGTLGTARMGSGTANSSTFLRGDGSWQTPTSSNIYNSDGTLSGARTVTMAGNGLTFTGGQTTIKGAGTTSATKALSVQNSAGTELMYMPDNGGLVVGPSLTLGSSAYAVKCIANFEVVNSSNSQFFFCAHATRNFTFGSNSSPSTGTLVISVPRATAPTTGLTNHFSIYGKEASAGNTCLHTRTENGAIVKIYQETTAVTSSVFVENTGNNVKEDSTFDGYTVAQVVKALRNLGILA
jgi:cyclophilin family peptidyl-prolyl cis-trans isomerase